METRNQVRERDENKLYIRAWRSKATDAVYFHECQYHNEAARDEMMRRETALQLKEAGKL